MNTIIVTALVLEMFSAPVNITIHPDVDAIAARSMLSSSPVVLTNIVDGESAWCIGTDLDYPVETGKSAEIDLDNIKEPIQLLLAKPVVYDMNAVEKACMVTYDKVVVRPL